MEPAESRNLPLFTMYPPLPEVYGPPTEDRVRMESNIRAWYARVCEVWSSLGLDRRDAMARTVNNGNW